MKRIPTGFLKVVLVLVALGVFTCLVWFPQKEGRAAHLDLFHIYTDPFILYTYLSAMPFFIGLSQAFKLLSLIEQNKAFSHRALRTLRNIKLSSLTLTVFIILALIYIRFFAHGDDPAGPTMLGFITCLIAVIIATAATIFQKLLQHAVELKSEHDLTV